jgi:hypothetical protein
MVAWYSRSWEPKRIKLSVQTKGSIIKSIGKFCKFYLVRYFSF